MIKEIVASNATDFVSQVNRIRRINDKYSIKAKFKQAVIRLHGMGTQLQRVRVNDTNQAFTTPKTTSEFISTLTQIAENVESK